MRTFHQKYRGNNRVTVFCKNRKPKQGWKEILRGLVFLTLIFFLLSGCQITKAPVKVGNDHPTGVNWAKKLGFPDDRIILILHADDLGMCREANLSGIRYLEEGQIQSGAAMPPCPAFEEIIAWARQHPKKDLGLHLTLTSEWQTYRWGPVSPVAEVPGLIDPDGYLWRSVEEVVQHATAEEVEREIRAQIEKSLALGYAPDHIDTHMGTLYGHASFTSAYLKVAEEYGIPAMVIDISNPAVLEALRAQGYPADEAMIRAITDYSLPKLDYFYSVPRGKTYEEKRENFYRLLQDCQPGLTEIIFHPSDHSEALKTITNSWQQRVWEAQMFADPEVIAFMKSQKIVFTNWREIMQRFKKYQKP
jgi:chitin disaccharide deacetylase